MELSIGKIFTTIWLIAYIHGNFPFLTPHHTRRKQQFSRFNRETTIDLANVSLLFPFLPPYNMLSAMSRCGSILSLLPRFTCVFWWKNYLCPLQKLCLSQSSEIIWIMKNGLRSCCESQSFLYAVGILWNKKSL